MASNRPSNSIQEGPGAQTHAERTMVLDSLPDAVKWDMLHAKFAAQEVDWLRSALKHGLFGIERQVGLEAKMQRDAEQVHKPTWAVSAVFDNRSVVFDPMVRVNGEMVAPMPNQKLALSEEMSSFLAEFVSASIADYKHARAAALDPSIKVDLDKVSALATHFNMNAARMLAVVSAINDVASTHDLIDASVDCLFTPIPAAEGVGLNIVEDDDRRRSFQVPPWLAAYHYGAVDTTKLFENSGVSAQSKIGHHYDTDGQQIDTYLGYLLKERIVDMNPAVLVGLFKLMQTSDGNYSGDTSVNISNSEFIHSLKQVFWNKESLKLLEPIVQSGVLLTPLSDKSTQDARDENLIKLVNGSLSRGYMQVLRGYEDIYPWHQFARDGRLGEDQAKFLSPGTKAIRPPLDALLWPNPDRKNFAGDYVRDVDTMVSEVIDMYRKHGVLEDALLRYPPKTNQVTPLEKIVQLGLEASLANLLADGLDFEAAAARKIDLLAIADKHYPKAAGMMRATLAMRSIDVVLDEMTSAEKVEAAAPIPASRSKGPR